MARLSRQPHRIIRWLLPNLIIVILLVPALANAQQFIMLLVPYHSQIPPGDPVIPPNWPWVEPGNPAMSNGYCTCACIDMLFNFYENAGHANPPLPQQEIAAVANTNDVMGGGSYFGTYSTDARRAVHFSSTTANWPTQPPPYVGGTGYSWRSACPSGLVPGFVGIDGNWTANGWNMAQFKQVLLAGYPIIVHVNADSVTAHPPVLDPNDSDTSFSGYHSVQTTVCGHSIVVRGFDDRPGRNVFQIHDPTLGCALMVNQQTFWNSWWGGGGDFLLVAPWGSGINQPVLQGGVVPQNFQLNGTASYTDPLPTVGTGANAQTSGTLSFLQLLVQVAKLAQGQAATLQFNQVVTSGQSQTRPWQCVASAFGQCTAQLETRGRVSPVAQSFPGGYTDDLGSFTNVAVAVPQVFLKSDPSLCYVPREDNWWDGPHLFSTPHDYRPGLPNQLVAQVENRGDVTATNVMVQFFYGDPSVAEYYPDPFMTPFATMMVPSIAPGATVDTNPVTFVPPATGNSFGQPYYSFVVKAECAGDPMHDIWVEFDNNIMCESEHLAEAFPGEPAYLHFYEENPFQVPCWVATKLEVGEPLPHGTWSEWLEPAGMDSMILLPHDRIARTLVVVPGSQWVGTYRVYADVYAVGSNNFMGRTGGVLFRVSTAGTSVPETQVIASIALAPPSPNPASGASTISFALPSPAHAEVTVYNVAGKLVAGVYRGAAPAGWTTATWDGRDAGGSEVGTGIYFVRLEVGEETFTRKLVLLR